MTARSDRSTTNLGAFWLLLELAAALARKVLR
jgi:hypothetical protein